VGGLSPEHRSEFFQVLHQAAITRQDIELARLLRALQLYKAFYEEIPARVQEAMEEADDLAARIKALDENIASRLERAMGQLQQNTQTASLTAVELRETQTRLAAAVEKSAAQVVRSLDAVLRKSLETGLLKPFESSLSDVRNQCTHTASQAKQMTGEFKLARRIHIGGYALAAAVIALTLTVEGWFTAVRHYSQREAELLQQINQNRLVLSELARKNAVLQVERDPADSRKLYLLMKRAKT